MPRHRQVTNRVTNTGRDHRQGHAHWKRPLETHVTFQRPRSMLRPFRLPQ